MQFSDISFQQVTVFFFVPLKTNKSNPSCFEERKSSCCLFKQKCPVCNLEVYSYSSFLMYRDALTIGWHVFGRSVG